MIQPLVTVSDLAERVGEDIVDRQDVALAKSLIRLVSAQVRHYGGDWEDPLLAPEVAIAITVEAAARGYMNPAGFKLERGDEITIDRFELFARGSTLSAPEIAALKQSAGRSGWVSVLVVRDVTVTDSEIVTATNV